MANKVILVGNLGADPDVRTFANGGKVANLSVATAERWRDRNTGERQERTEWHRVAIMGDGLAGVAERYLRKGSRVYLEGQLRTRKWQDQEGRDRYTTEVVVAGHGGTLELLGDPQGGGGAGGDPGPGPGGGAAGAAGSSGRGGGPGDLDDDIPF